MKKQSTVDDLIENIPDQRRYDDLFIRMRKINNHTVLFSLFGKHVLEYIHESLSFRANDPYSFSNEVTERLFNMIFSEHYNFEFNNHIKIEKTLIIEKLEGLAQQGFNLKQFIDKYKKNDQEFLNFEIDAELQMKTITKPSILFENKLFTCPNQSSDILLKYLYPEKLKNFFSIRNHLGLITFSNIHDSNDKNKPFIFPKEVQKENRYEWFLHFIIIDQNALNTTNTAREFGDEILDEIRNDHRFFLEELKLNTYNCSISLIENYVKVVHMSYYIEELKNDLEELRSEIKEERKQKEEERKQKEEERKQKEEERKQKEEERKQKEILLKTLKKAGIPSPLDKK